VTAQEYNDAWFPASLPLGWYDVARLGLRNWVPGGITDRPIQWWKKVLVKGVDWVLASYMVRSLTSLSHLSGCLGAAFLLVLGGQATARETTLAEWNFDRPSALQVWRPNGDLTDVTVTNGAMACRATGGDPILELSQWLSVPARVWQFVEIELKADRDGIAELFWTGTTTGKYGGFAQEKTTRFPVRGDNAWHIYRVLPCWQLEKRIVRMRLDVYDATAFELKSIRIKEVEFPRVSSKAVFDFSRDAEGWQLVDTSGGASFVTDWKPDRLRAGNRVLLSPPFMVEAETHAFVSIRMTVDRGRHATLFFASEDVRGLQSVTVPLEADGQAHTYNVEVLGATHWHGRIAGLGLRPSDDTNALARIEWIRVADQPGGAAELKVVSFAAEDALPRVGVPGRVRLNVVNRGGEIASEVTAKIQLPSGVVLEPSSRAEQALPALGFGDQASLSWTIVASGPMHAALVVALTGPKGEWVAGKTSVRFTPKVAVAPQGYVPKPRPVRGKYEVGVYYFPGWKSASQWQPIQDYPERRPVLGWYREGAPEIADWHIKWAVEHGITFFAYDWYWNQGARHLEHALHDGYFQSRYRHLLKFCLLWANHNPPHTSSVEDCLAVTRYWIENYFRRPEHLTYNGAPVIIIFAPDRLTEDLGTAGVKGAFARMRNECKAAGFPGLHLAACVGDAAGAHRAAQEGYDSVTAYTWPGAGMGGEGFYAPFETLLEGYRRQWDHVGSAGSIPLYPLPVCGGWDSRPWHGENNIVRFGRTPQLFKRHLQDALAVSEKSSTAASKASGKAGSPKAILVEAWNEWGEGSYIEPHAEYGFGYLDAIRDVFTSAPAKHEDATPADADLGPYEVPPLEALSTEWSAHSGREAWENTMQLASLNVREGKVSGVTTGNDPAFVGPAMRARAAEFKTVLVRIKLSKTAGGMFKDSAQLFWRTARLAESESSSLRFEVIGDGQWHDYRIPVGTNNRWRGLITRLRLDPCNQADVLVEIEFVRLTN
jgi:hypothetical protein